MTKKISRLSFSIRMIEHNKLFFLNQLDGKEELSKPFIFRLTVSSYNKLEDFKPYIGSQALFGVEKRQWHGYIMALKQMSPVEYVMRYCFIIRPWTALMSNKIKSRIFKNINILEVVSNVFNEEKNASYCIQCRRKYMTHEYIIQYKETNIQFISRLLANANIFYYFTHQNNRHTMIIMDDPYYLPIIKDLQDDSDNMTDWRVRHSIKKTNQTIDGKSYNIAFSPGYLLSNKSYFITRLTHSIYPKKLQRTATYSNYFRAHALNTYQVLPKTECIIKGHQFAKIVNSQPFLVDDQNRIGITFAWDSNNTCVWAPIVQQQAGNQYGHQWLPRAGEEVLVIFCDGDLQRPFIINSVTQKTNENDFYITNRTFDAQNYRSSHFNQLLFNKEKMTSGIRITAARNLHIQANNNIEQNINGNYFVKSKYNNINLKNNNILIKSKKNIVFKVGASILELTKEEIKIHSPKIILQNQRETPCFSAARLNDTHICPRITANIPHRGGRISNGALSIFINGKPAARIGDPSPCNILVDKIISGASQILFEGKPAAKTYDKMQHGGKIITGSSNVQIGCAENLNFFAEQKELNENKKFYIKVNCYLF